MDRTAVMANIERVVSWFTVQRRAATAVCLLRAAIGLVSVAFYLITYADRRFLFGPDGLYGAAMMQDLLAARGAFSLYLASESLVWFEIVFHAGFALAVAVTIGLGGRLALGLHGAFIWSLYMTNPTLMDGGDNLVVLVIPFLLLTRCFDRLTVSTERRSDRRSLAGIVAHNTGILLIAVQLCIVYLLAGLYKVQGKLWQDGTALYYILRVPEFFWPQVTPLIFHLGWVLVLAAYATVLVSIFFPAFVLFRAGRPIAVAAMVVFHCGIALLMNLTSFALVMIALDLIFVDSQAERIVRQSRSLLRSAVRGGERILRKGTREHVPSLEA
ncbi:HTTM domain-containing protein [Curtobacterium citreum]|nr:HTTM domain-containing protein [Curtobacterium citreum]